MKSYKNFSGSCFVRGCAAVVTLGAVALTHDVFEGSASYGGGGSGGGGGGGGDGGGGGG